jgi:glutathione synthase
MRIALQMDPIESINIDVDSSFLLGLGALERGHELFYYQPKDLFSKQGRIYAHAQKISLKREKGNHVQFLSSHTLDVANEVDVILLRQNLPINMGYLANTFLLDHLPAKVRIVNSPAGIRNTPGKIFPTLFPDLTPPTLIAGNLDEIKAFAALHGDVVAKRLFNSAGIDVFRFSAKDPALLTFAAEHFSATKEPIALQAFLPSVFQGDKRIILFDGKPVAALNRIPKEGEFRANLAQGGRGEVTDMTDREKLICDKLGPLFRERGLYFVGIDVIGGYVTEVNPGSPTGLQGINQLYKLTGDKRMEMLFWKGLE